MSKTINKRKTNAIRKYNVKRTEETLNKCACMKIAKKLDIDRKKLYALKDEQGQIANNSDKEIKVPEQFYTKLYNNYAR